MIAIDTNVVVRLLVSDDLAQYEKARHVVAMHEVFVPDTVILETEWVLRYAYGFAFEAVCDALIKLFGLPNVHLANPALIAQAIDWHRQGLDFADALHLANSKSCEILMTFDAQFVKRARGLSACAVKSP